MFTILQVFILVVIFGLFHGLCFLPVVLSIIGPKPYYNAGPEGTESSRLTTNVEKVSVMDIQSNLY